MTTLYVQFSDSNQTAIASVFVNPQNDSEFTNQGTIDPSDARWKAYFDALPASMQAGLTSPT